MAKTKCPKCGRDIDNRAIKRHITSCDKVPEVMVTVPPECVIGKHPKTYNVERRQKIAELRCEGKGYRRIGKELNLKPAKVRKIVKELEAEWGLAKPVSLLATVEI